ncbi:hypothetical protein D3C85_1112830 [compost metagenome]
MKLLRGSVFIDNDIVYHNTIIFQFFNKTVQYRCVVSRVEIAVKGSSFLQFEARDENLRNRLELFNEQFKLEDLVLVFKNVGL